MKRLLAALVILAALSACTPNASPAPSASGDVAATAAINEQTRGEIQALLQKQNNAIATRDNNTFQSTVDQDRGALRRCANESFDIASRQGAPRVGQVGKIDAYLYYVRAYVNEGSNGARRLFFRKIDGRWVQSEPKEEELGGEKKKMVDDIQLEYWGVDEDVVDALAKGVQTAKGVVLANLLSTDRRDALAARFYPTRSVAGIIACSVAGSHFANVPSDPFIRIVRYWFDANAQLTPFTVGVISHEWLHWAQDQFSAGIVARLPFWLAEGWPDYVGGVTRSYTQICSGVPTLKQLEDGADTSDPNTPPELSAQYYIYANSMIDYLYQTYGGADGYRKLLLAFKEDARPEIAMPKALAVTPAAFYSAWLAYAKKKYC